MKGTKKAYPNIQIEFLRSAGDIGGDPNSLIDEVNKKKLSCGKVFLITKLTFFLNVSPLGFTGKSQLMFTLDDLFH